MPFATTQDIANLQAQIDANSAAATQRLDDLQAQITELRTKLTTGGIELQVDNLRVAGDLEVANLVKADTLQAVHDCIARDFVASRDVKAAGDVTAASEVIAPEIKAGETFAGTDS